MGIYDKESEVSKEELRESFDDDRGRIPDRGGKSYDRATRNRIQREVFGEKYGDTIDRHEFRRAINRLNSKRNAAKTPEEKAQIKEKIDYLKSVGGWRV